MLCDSKGGGYIANRLKYLRTQNNRLSRGAVSSESDACEDDPSSCEEDIQFLKTAVVNADNMAIIKTKLTATSEHRRKMIREDKSLDLLKYFPYFFVCPQLVRMNFNTS